MSSFDDMIAELQRLEAWKREERLLESLEADKDNLPRLTPDLIVAFKKGDASYVLPLLRALIQDYEDRNS